MLSGNSGDLAAALQGTLQSSQYASLQAVVGTASAPLLVAIAALPQTPKIAALGAGLRDMPIALNALSKAELAANNLDTKATGTCQKQGPRLP